MERYRNLGDPQNIWEETLQPTQFSQRRSWEVPVGQAMIPLELKIWQRAANVTFNTGLKVQWFGSGCG